MNEIKQPGAAGEWTSDPEDLLDIAVGFPDKETEQKLVIEESHSPSNGANGFVPPPPAEEPPAGSAEEAVEETIALELPLVESQSVEVFSDSPVVAEESSVQQTPLLLPAPQPVGYYPPTRSAEPSYYPEYEPAQPVLVEAEPQENWFKLLLKETLETVVLAVVIFLLIRVAVQNYRIEGSSMEPNFHNGEYLLVNKLAYRLGEYQRGDVIVFKYPGDTTKDYIKRVIGLPGDTVEIREGMLYVNDQLITEPYNVMPMHYLNEMPRVVEPGTLYVMGDNRPASSDTRDWGLLDQELVIGQAWLAIYPFDTFGLVNHPELHFTPGMAQGP
ncbi:MAG: signal peptidase I [Caldilineaceae bacterium]|nr:signal peptidase I [Caldilineaceae bacterium]